MFYLQGLQGMRCAELFYIRVGHSLYFGANNVSSHHDNNCSFVEVMIPPFQIADSVFRTNVGPGELSCKTQPIKKIIHQTSRSDQNEVKITKK